MINSVIAISFAILFVVVFVLIYGLRDALLEHRGDLDRLVQSAVKKELSQWEGDTALISTSWDLQKEAVVFHIENVGEGVLEVKSFRFFTEDFVPLGEVLNDYPSMPPGKGLNFSIEVLNHDGLDNLRVLVTMETEDRNEDFLVQVPLKDEPFHDILDSGHDI